MRTFSDAELVKQTHDGLISGFELLVRRYHPHCMRLAIGILNNTEEAEETVQDAFMRVYTHISSFRGDAKFSTWLYRIVYNLCYTRLRNKRSFVDVSIVEDRYEDRLLQNTAGEPEGKIFEDKDLVERVTSLLHELPDRYKSVLHFFYIEDMTLEEIAAVMNINRNSVKVRLYRGRMLLREMVAEKIGEDVTG
jgi:RNA polymerase sigma factor (sigma-70 family)